MIRFLAFSCVLFANALFTIVLLTGQASAADTIYQSTDKRGNPVFTDQPPPNARPVELPPINTTPPIAPAATPGPAPAKAFAGYSRIDIGVSSTIPNGLAPTTIGIDLQPELQAGHRWQLLLDGAVQEVGSGGSATIDRLERGTHQLELRVLDATGAVVGSSSSKEVFVYWPGGKNN